ncbi:hypothetical protein HY625_00120 [Candidatus Uhrbacteria bacterium]|nr:hypothetical protein [Candidatus Uhrbacteria bacterium]
MEAADWKKLVDNVGMGMATNLVGDALAEEENVLSHCSDSVLLDICNEADRVSAIGAQALAILTDRFTFCTCEEYLRLIAQVKRGTSLFDWLLYCIEKTAKTFDEWFGYWMLCYRESNQVSAARSALTGMQKAARRADPNQWIDVLRRTVPGTGVRQEILNIILDLDDRGIFVNLEDVFIILTQRKIDGVFAEKIFTRIVESPSSSHYTFISLLDDDDFPDDKGWRNRCLVESAKQCVGLDEWDSVFEETENEEEFRLVLDVMDEEDPDLDLWLHALKAAHARELSKTEAFICGRISAMELSLEECGRVFREAPLESGLRRVILIKARALLQP